MTFIIAEMSANHGGSLDKAKEMIKAAQWAGCHAVKFQLYNKEDLPGTYDPKLHVEMKHDIPALASYCRFHKIPLVLSIFGWWAIEYVAGLPIYALKFASPESTRLEPESYKRMARLIKEYKQRFWVSSGYRDWAFMSLLNPDVHFFCPPGHPAKFEGLDLYKVRGNGFSDHTTDIIAAVAAAKAGATHIEKHFMLDSHCVDFAFSIYPSEMRTLCDLCS